MYSGSPPYPHAHTPDISSSGPFLQKAWLYIDLPQVTSHQPVTHLIKERTPLPPRTPVQTTCSVYCSSAAVTYKLLKTYSQCALTCTIEGPRWPVEQFVRVPASSSRALLLQCWSRASSTRLPAVVVAKFEIVDVSTYIGICRRFVSCFCLGTKRKYGPA